MGIKNLYIIGLLLTTLNGVTQEKNWVKDGDFNMDHHFYKEAATKSVDQPATPFIAYVNAIGKELMYVA